MGAHGGFDRAGADASEDGEADQEAVWLPANAPSGAVRRGVPGRAGGRLPKDRRGQDCSSSGVHGDGRAASGVHEDVGRGSRSAMRGRPPLADGARLPGRDQASVLAGSASRLPPPTHQARPRPASSRAHVRARAGDPSLRLQEAPEVDSHRVTAGPSPPTRSPSAAPGASRTPSIFLVMPRGTSSTASPRSPVRTPKTSPETPGSPSFSRAA